METSMTLDFTTQIGTLDVIGSAMICVGVAR